MQNQITYDLLTAILTLPSLARQAIRALNDKVVKDDRVSIAMLSFADGVTVVVREK
jgi:hypothetical protein